MIMRLTVIKANLTMMLLGNMAVYFSYETAIAFRTPTLGLVCSENIWSKGTSKHLAVIGSVKKDRIDNAEFQQQLDQALLHSVQLAAINHDRQLDGLTPIV